MDYYPFCGLMVTLYASRTGEWGLVGSRGLCFSVCAKWIIILNKVFFNLFCISCPFRQYESLCLNTLCVSCQRLTAWYCYFDSQLMLPSSVVVLFAWAVLWCSVTTELGTGEVWRGLKKTDLCARVFLKYDRKKKGVPVSGMIHAKLFPKRNAVAQQEETPWALTNHLECQITD